MFIFEYRCNRCGFSFPEGWGGYFYVEVDREYIEHRLAKIREELECLGDALENVGAMERDADEVVFRLQGRLRKFVQAEFARTIKRVINYLEGHIEDLLSQKKELEGIKSQLEAKGARAIRIPCPHPSEKIVVREILGPDASPDIVRARTGFNSHCVCLDCLYQFDADLRDEKANMWREWYGFSSSEDVLHGKPIIKDKRKCPVCESGNVRTVSEMIGNTCPRCKEGVIEAIWTGKIS